MTGGPECPVRTPGKPGRYADSQMPNLKSQLPNPKFQILNAE